MVDSVALSTGQMVDPSQPVFTVADLSTVWVPLQVPENQIGAVQVGDPVALTVDAYPGRIFTGRVAYIADKVDPNTGTVMVRCEVPNPDGALRVNMFANGTIEAAARPPGPCWCPLPRCRTSMARRWCSRPTGHGQFAWHAVQPGLSTGGYTQILSGIAPGTPVVTDGSYWLKATLMQPPFPTKARSDGVFRRTKRRFALVRAAPLERLRRKQAKVFAPLFSKSGLFPSARQTSRATVRKASP